MNHIETVETLFDHRIELLNSLILADVKPAGSFEQAASGIYFQLFIGGLLDILLRKLALAK